MPRNKKDIADTVLPGYAGDGRIFFHSLRTNDTVLAVHDQGVDEATLRNYVKRNDVADIPALADLAQELTELLSYYRKEAWFQWQWHNAARDYIQHLQTILGVSHTLISEYQKAETAQALPKEIGARTAASLNSYFQCVLPNDAIDMGDKPTPYQPYIEAKNRRDEFEVMRGELRRVRAELEGLKAQFGK